MRSIFSIVHASPLLLILDIRDRDEKFHLQAFVPSSRTIQGALTGTEGSNAIVGTPISHYRIIEMLDQGGIGEGYLGEDSHLDRKVALKRLPEHLSKRADLSERFERGASAGSSLDCPHIFTLYDIGVQDGTL